MKEYKIVYCGGEGEIVEKKSRFIATVKPVDSEEEASAFIAEMKKKYWDARHNCSAFVIGEHNEIQRSSDDGEPAGTAGHPMLDVLLGEGIHNTAVVVTRYFGGTLLGTGGLIRAYTNAAKEALSVCRLGELTEGVHAFLDVDYNYVGKVQYICAQNDITIVNTEYADGVTFELMMENAARNVLEKNMTEMSSGKICLRDTCSMQMYRDDTGKLCR